MFADELRRYGRSRGLWLLLLVVPIAARYLVVGSAVHIALRQHLLSMTWGAVGVTIGVVASTMLLPIGFLYLRSNVTRRRPWQVEDVSPTPRIAMVLGRFGADCVVLLGALAVATLAGGILAWRAQQGPVDPGRLTLAVWLIAGPSLVCLVALRHVLNAVPATRGALGDVLAFCCWFAILAMPSTMGAAPSSFAVNLRDPGGYIRPIIGSGALFATDFAVGGGPVLPGRVPLDVDAGLHAPGYVGARLAWLAIGLVTALFAGLIDRPARISHRRPRSRAAPRWLRRTVAVPATTVPAGPERSASVAVFLSQFRLIGHGVAFPFLAIGAAALGLASEYRHIGSPAALLLLVFALSAQAGRDEAPGLQRLTATMPTSPTLRRAAFVVAGAAWALLMALPHAAIWASTASLLLALATGAGAAIIAGLIATVARSAFAPRMVLLVAWYAYFAS
ncbi:hypothetical protein [Sphingomonas sp. NFR04]|uniref:hypothetical protein n=1 Tax=Sphingomonas sp. NFR04 TaxID=1566283 RepID=UPI0020C91EFF|nr:hypothetical protein [Sphingomonas sp. NFR04]